MDEGAEGDLCCTWEKIILRCEVLSVRRCSELRNVYVGMNRTERGDVVHWTRDCQVKRKVEGRCDFQPLTVDAGLSFAAISTFLFSASRRSLIGVMTVSVSLSMSFLDILHLSRCLCGPLPGCVHYRTSRRPARPVRAKGKIRILLLLTRSRLAAQQLQRA